MQEKIIPLCRPKHTFLQLRFPLNSSRFKWKLQTCCHLSRQQRGTYMVQTVILLSRFLGSNYLNNLMCTVWSILTKYIHADYKRVLTGLVCSVIVLDQKRVTVVPDLLASIRVVFGNQRLQLWIKDALAYDNINWRLTIPSWYHEGSLPHGMHWRRWEGGRGKCKKNKTQVSDIEDYRFPVRVKNSWQREQQKRLPKKTLKPTFHVALRCFLHFCKIHYLKNNNN